MVANERNTLNNTKRSRVVTIISILYLLIGFITALVATLGVIVHLMRNINIGLTEPFSSFLLTIVGIVWGTLMVIVGFGLWKLKRWAYWMAIVISGLLAMTNIITLLSALSRGQSSSTSYIGIIFHGFVFVGLLSRAARATFTSS
jgi:hypothetical protein